MATAMAPHSQRPPESDPIMTAERDGEDDDTKPFRLLDLPPELWSRTGRMVVDECEQVTVYSFCSRQQTGKAANIPGLRDVLALTSTCHQLRDELLPYFYSTKLSFAVPVQTISSAFPVGQIVGSWLGKLQPAHRAKMRGLEVFDYVVGGAEVAPLEERLQRCWKMKLELSFLGTSRSGMFKKYEVKFLE